LVVLQRVANEDIIDAGAEFVVEESVLRCGEGAVLNVLVGGINGLNHQHGVRIVRNVRNETKVVPQ